MKILFLPLFRMPSGHHRVADALMDTIQRRTKKIECKKVDLLSYSNKKFEKMISSLYLTWIYHTPQTYDWSYKHFAYTRSHKHCSFRGFEHYFLHYLKKLLHEEKPDLVVCSHGFPSLLMSRLKQKGIVHIPVINAYTDFFMNDIWGREGIDYHFVPNLEVKNQMVKNYGIDERKIMVTGIPVHETFLKPGKAKEKNEKKKVLIAGGSSGLGNIAGFIQHTMPSGPFEYVILCGKNHRLYEKIQQMHLPHVTALPYMSSRGDMNTLYNSVDAIVTKPGGVTVSEALKKGLPIFVHSYLPGQEYINLQYLKDHHLVYEVQMNDQLEKQIAQVLGSDIEKARWERARKAYLAEQDMASTNLMYNFLSAVAQEGAHINKYHDMSWPPGFIGKLKKYAKKLPISGNV